MELVLAGRCHYLTHMLSGKLALLQRLHVHGSKADGAVLHVIHTDFDVDGVSSFILEIVVHTWQKELRENEPVPKLPLEHQETHHGCQDGQHPQATHEGWLYIEYVLGIAFEIQD